MESILPRLGQNRLGQGRNAQNVGTKMKGFVPRNAHMKYASRITHHSKLKFREDRRTGQNNITPSRILVVAA